ncbi:MAG: exosortase V [Sphingomonadales bacterium]
MATLHSGQVPSGPNPGILPPIHDLLTAARKLTLPTWALIIGILAIAVPTMVSVARETWSTEQGGHGPIVFATGLWLLARQWPSIESVRKPGSTWVVALALGILVPLYVLCRITAIVEIEGYVMYAAVLTVLYGWIGGAAMRLLWFPLFYLAFMLPPPETVVALVTQPLKIAISQWAIALLYWVGYPIGGAGVTIQIGQYQLLVAAACSGLNSLISLFALSLFYVYMRHRLHWQYAMMLVLVIIPIAIFANFVRVIILILLTHYQGEAVAQGFMHNFAGLVMFMIAMLTIFLVDVVAYPIWTRFHPEENHDDRP